MKILIMSVRAGYGHHSTAKAIIEYFSERGHECEMLDIFDYVNTRLGNTIQDMYLLSTKYLYKPYGKVYNKMNQEEEPYDKISLTSFFSTLITRKLKSYVKNFAPDLIIGTHSYAAVVMTLMREKNYIHCPLMGIVTDFTVHPFWESTDLDHYIIPHSSLTYQMCKKGIKKEALLPIGIPIKKEFSSRLPKQTAREILGIHTDKPTILVMMGSMGFGNMAENLMEIDEFDADFQVMVVCGTNEKAKKSIDKTKWEKPIYTYAFVNNVDVMMDAADLIISKPGGLTTSESLAKGLPMISLNPLPGQENKNISFLTNNGAAISVNDDFSISEALYQFFFEKWRIELINEAIANLQKPDSTKDLYEFIIANYDKKPQEELAEV